MYILHDFQVSILQTCRSDVAGDGDGEKALSGGLRQGQQFPSRRSSMQKENIYIIMIRRPGFDNQDDDFENHHNSQTYNI